MQTSMYFKAFKIVISTQHTSSSHCAIKLESNNVTVMKMHQGRGRLKTPASNMKKCSCLNTRASDTNKNALYYNMIFKLFSPWECDGEKETDLGQFGQLSWTPPRSPERGRWSIFYHELMPIMEWFLFLTSCCGLIFVPRILCWSPNPHYFKLWPLFGDEVFKEVIKVWP